MRVCESAQEGLRKRRQEDAQPWDRHDCTAFVVLVVAGVWCPVVICQYIGMYALRSPRARQALSLGSSTPPHTKYRNVRLVGPSCRAPSYSRRVRSGTSS